MTTAKEKRHYTNWLETESERILKWAGYIPHTIFHRGRYPLIGDWNTWERLEDRLDFQRKGRLPKKEIDKDNQHVLDVIIFSSQDRNYFNLVKTDMHTIVFWHPSSYKITPSDIQQWFNKMELIDGSIATIDLDSTTSDLASGFYHETAVDDEHTDLDRKIASTINPSVPKSKSSHKCVKLIKNNRNNQPKEVDRLSVVFSGGGLSDILFMYQEYCIHKIMKECAAIVYNPNLLQDDPPDGYYLCHAECLGRLEQYFYNATHIFVTKDVFDPPENGNYILLAVEAKLSMDCLQDVLYNKKNYYIFNLAPQPIRHFTVLGGGIESYTWMFLINLANICSADRDTSIDEDISEVSRELARRLRSSSTHVVHLPCFSSETFRQEPLTEARLEFLCGLLETNRQRKVLSKKTQKRLACKIIFGLLDAFVSKNPVKEPRSNINDRILLDPATRDNTELLSFLEQLALSLVREVYRNTAQCNNEANIPVPKWIIQLVEKLRFHHQSRPIRELAESKQQLNLTNNISASEIPPEISINEEVLHRTTTDDDISSLILNSSENITEADGT